MNIISANFKEVFSNIKYLVFGLFIFFLMLYLFNYFTDDTLIKGNMGVNYYYINIITQIIMSVLFAIFLPVSIYKFVKFNKFDFKNNTSSFFGTFMGIIVAGCPACSISIASYLGLASLLSFLPYYGLELKIIGSILLIYANYNILNDMNLCKLSMHK